MGGSVYFQIREEEKEKFESFVKRCSYLRGEYHKPDGFIALKEKVAEIQSATDNSKLFYGFTYVAISEELLLKLSA